MVLKAHFREYYPIKYHLFSDNFVKYISNNKEPAMKYHDRSIFQHPKIQAPNLSHSIYNSVYFDDDMDDSEVQPSSAHKSPEKPHYSMASRKYLEKHRLVSPPTKDVEKKNSVKSEGKARKEDKIICRNGKIMQLRNGNRNSGSENESFDLHRLQI